MENTQEISEKQVPNEWLKEETIQNSEIKQKLDILISSELSKLQWFKSFIEYLSEKENKDKLDTICKIIQNGFTEELKQYVNINSTDWKDVLNEDYLEIKEIFEKEILKKEEIIEAKEAEKTTEQKIIEAKEAEKTTEQKIIEAKEAEKTTEQKIIEAKEAEKTKKQKISEYWENKIKFNKNITIYNESKKILENTPELKYIVNLLNNKEINWLNYEKLGNLEDANNSSKEVLQILADKQQEIFEVLLKKYKQSWTKEDEQTVLKFADTFKALWVIDDTRHNQIIQEVFKIREESNKTKEFWWNKSLPLITDHEQKWDTLSRHADKVDFTIKDWVITCEWKSMKLVDYSSHDKETKAFMKKTWISGEINELNWELKQNEFILKWLIALQNKNPEQITESDISLITNEIWNKVPWLKDTLWRINSKEWESKDKLKEIIWVLYSFATWSNNPWELGWEESSIEYKISSCKQKIEEKNNTIRKDILKKEKIIQEIEKEFPNLNQEEINIKIKEKENKMQDTIAFCDMYWLSALWNIANIKQVIKVFLKKEWIELKDIDIWEWTELEKKEYTKHIKKWMTELLKKIDLNLVKSEENLYKSGNETITSSDGENKIVEWWLKAPNETNITSIDNLNSLLKKEVKINWVWYSVLKNITWELNTKALEEILHNEPDKVTNTKSTIDNERKIASAEADSYLEKELAGLA